MVGIVVVSHSARLADGVVELAIQMAGPDVTIVAAGGMDLPDRPLGTDAALIARAIDQAWSDDGVVVLMDLGSAVLSAEMAAENGGRSRARIEASSSGAGSWTSRTTLAPPIFGRHPAKTRKFGMLWT